MNNQICPYCGCELEQGTFHSRGGNYFLPNGEKTPSFYTEKAMEKRKAILLPPDPFQWKDRNIPTPTYAGPAKKSSSPMSTPISKAETALTGRSLLAFTGFSAGTRSD